MWPKGVKKGSQKGVKYGSKWPCDPFEKGPKTGPSQVPNRFRFNSERVRPKVTGEGSNQVD